MEVRMASETAYRQQLGKMLDWDEAHVGLDKAVADLPVELRGKQPPGLPHSIWQLVEHIRIAQHDILDFSVNADYEEMKWPDDYWPASPAPPSAAAWDESLAQIRRDVKALQELAADGGRDLTARIPHGNGQTIMRELALVADHNAYHVGQIVLVRRLLGAWK
jgi:uncharacterized damage-inducible protein DinB